MNEEADQDKDKIESENDQYLKQSSAGKSIDQDNKGELYNKYQIEAIVKEKLDEQRSLESIMRLQFENFSTSIHRQIVFYGVVISLIISIFGFFGYQNIINLVRSQIEEQLKEKLVTPEIEKSVANALEKESEIFITKQIEPLNIRTDKIKKDISNLMSLTQAIEPELKRLKMLAASIEPLEKRVENQSTTVNWVAKEASKAKEISEEVAEKNRIAGEKLATLDKAIDQVKKLAVGLSDAIASSLATADNPFQYIHLKYKIRQIENIRGILQELDIPEKEINQALNVFTSRIVAGHMGRILNYLNKKLPVEKKLFTNIDEINIDNWDLRRVRQTLRENEIEPDGELKETILDLEFYLENKKLRRESKWQG